MLITGEQFNVMCTHCFSLIAFAKNIEELLHNWPSWDEKSVFVDCFEGCCPRILLSQDGDELIWQLMANIHKPFAQWWQEILKAYDKKAKQGLVPKRPVKENMEIDYIKIETPR